ncbi:hypothetical protein [Pedobacter arcticus]|uniref:hypothetical protein n=1 Tax=Pedobacter arcticus TaxID=752140 RepID=UPI000375FC57|nr:hypothetical protein [Pedobacter arcticus]
MKSKKSHHLLIMLAVLIAHTLLLSTWLSNEETVQRKASIKSEAQEEEANQLHVLKTSYSHHKDSVTTHQPVVLTKIFNSNLK